jgi:ABC-type transport system involved in multi-copper enzyme maturation permease subunit
MLSILRAAKATALFELARSLTPGRFASSLVLGLFPPCMLGLIMLASRMTAEVEVVIMITVFLVILLSLLLWASPVVYAELEGRTWIYLASRPKGRYSTVLGKYVIAVYWSFAISWGSMTVCLLINEYFAHKPNETFRAWAIFSFLIALACPTYAAIFVFLGALFHRRAMVFCAGYILLSEIVLANVPAVVSRFTVRFHLLGLAIDLFDRKQWMPDPAMRAIFNRQPMWMDITCLMLFMVVFLAATMWALRTREYLTADEA